MRLQFSHPRARRTLADSTGASISTLIENNLLASGTVALTASRSKTALVSGTFSGTVTHDHSPSLQKLGVVGTSHLPAAG